MNELNGTFQCCIVTKCDAIFKNYQSTLAETRLYTYTQINGMVND